MLMKTKPASIMFFLLTLLVSCNGAKMPEKTISFPSIKDIPASSWEKLAKKKIYFGHQSVGYNIIDGVRDLMKEDPQIKLNIVESSKATDFEVAIFAHSRVGRNVDSGSKVDGFADLMGRGIGNKADFAFFKLCFVDILPRTDVDKVFENYKKTMASLKIKFPKTTFIHVTVPLTFNQTGVKAWIRKAKDLIKRIIGRTVFDFFDNAKRNEFNKKIRQEYAGKEPLFDIAKRQSTYPDGRRSLYKDDKKTFFSMVPGYTNDGGHLNGEGRKIVAEQLLILLAQLT